MTTTDDQRRAGRRGRRDRLEWRRRCEGDRLASKIVRAMAANLGSIVRYEPYPLARAQALNFPRD
ncbi:hypothetical protein J2Z19_005711 [Ensifer adhaerens]|uniref:Uncharacterized protein n=1 Tax=Ensifer adhaerens TaxID=106592 RepID=A0ACC5T552_ENSAD|nr:hypothetical protein [Ensifer adhaerens]MBP1875963.1 hypothetical protein [Ensifer adhaerens]